MQSLNILINVLEAGFPNYKISILHNVTKYGVMMLFLTNWSTSYILTFLSQPLCMPTFRVSVHQTNLGHFYHEPMNAIRSVIPSLPKQFILQATPCSEQNHSVLLLPHFQHLAKPGMSSPSPMYLNCYSNLRACITTY